jgi:hypothetical protein
MQQHDKIASWSIKGVSSNTRELAKNAAKRANMTIGSWIAHVVSQETKIDSSIPFEHSSYYEEHDEPDIYEDYDFPDNKDVTLRPHIGNFAAPKRKQPPVFVTKKMQEIENRISGQEGYLKELALEFTKYGHIVVGKCDKRHCLDIENKVEELSDYLRQYTGITRTIQKELHKLQNANYSAKSNNKSNAFDQEEDDEKQQQIAELKKEIASLTGHNSFSSQLNDFNQRLEKNIHETEKLQSNFDEIGKKTVSLGEALDELSEHTDNAPHGEHAPSDEITSILHQIQSLIEQNQTSEQHQYKISDRLDHHDGLLEDIRHTLENVSSPSEQVDASAHESHIAALAQKIRDFEAFQGNFEINFNARVEELLERAQRLDQDIATCKTLAQSNADLETTNNIVEKLQKEFGNIRGYQTKEFGNMLETLSNIVETISERLLFVEKKHSVLKNHYDTLSQHIVENRQNLENNENSPAQYGDDGEFDYEASYSVVDYTETDATDNTENFLNQDKNSLADDLQYISDLVNSSHEQNENHADIENHSSTSLATPLAAIDLPDKLDYKEINDTSAYEENPVVKEVKESSSEDSSIKTKMMVESEDCSDDYIDDEQRAIEQIQRDLHENIQNFEINKKRPAHISESVKNPQTKYDTQENFEESDDKSELIQIGDEQKTDKTPIISDDNDDDAIDIEKFSQLLRENLDSEKDIFQSEFIELGNGGIEVSNKSNLREYVHNTARHTDENKIIQNAYQNAEDGSSLPKNRTLKRLFPSNWRKKWKKQNKNDFSNISETSAETAVYRKLLDIAARDQNHASDEVDSPTESSMYTQPMFGDDEFLNIDPDTSATESETAYDGFSKFLNTNFDDDSFATQESDKDIHDPSAYFIEQKRKNHIFKVALIGLSSMFLGFSIIQLLQ